jgi:hypothetical protein
MNPLAQGAWDPSGQNDGIVVCRGRGVGIAMQHADKNNHAERVTPHLTWQSFDRAVILSDAPVAIVLAAQRTGVPAELT